MICKLICDWLFQNVGIIAVAYTSLYLHCNETGSRFPVYSTVTYRAAELKLRESKKLNITVHKLPVTPDDSVSFTELISNGLGLKPQVQS